MSLSKKYILYSISAVCTSVFFLAGVEVLLFAGYKITGSHYFETRNESESRVINPADRAEKRYFYPEDLKDKKSSQAGLKKIAIFGGSSAAGYASAVGFGDFIKNSQKDLIVHNYAKPGDPFSGFQSEILLKVMSYYDILIVYAGHNEIWTNLYSSAKILEKIYLPNGEQVTSSQFKNVKENLRPFLNEKNNGYLLASFFGEALRNSRLTWLLLRVSAKIKNSISPTDDEATGALKYPYFGHAQYLALSGGQDLKDRFRNTLTEIVKNLDQHQMLIVVPAFSNDLFPPIYQRYESREARNDGHILAVNSIAKSLYSKVLTGDLNSDLLAQLPLGAHRSYLLALECSQLLKGPSVRFGIISKECIKLFYDARNSDDLPFRSLDFKLTAKELTETSNKSQQVIVLDLNVNKVLQLLGARDYLDLFVDFQHPSEAGHMLIANSILTLIFPESKVSYSRFGVCNFSLSTTPPKEMFISPLRYQESTGVNISWLNRFIKRMPETFLYEYYRQRAQEKRVTCGLSESFAK